MTFRIITAMIKVTDLDVINKELVAVSAPVQIDLEKVSDNVPEADRRRYYLNLADEVAKAALPSAYGVSASLVDFKLSTGEIEVIDYTIADNLNGASLVAAGQEVSSLRNQLRTATLDGIEKFIVEQIAHIAPAIVAVHGEVPNAYSIRLGSEYDDNNYYTEVQEVSLMLSGWTSAQTNIAILDEYGDSIDPGSYLRELLKDNFDTVDIELSGVADELRHLTVPSPSPEAIEEAKKKLYYDDADLHYVYDIEGNIDNEDKNQYLQKRLDDSNLVEFEKHQLATGAKA